MNGNNNIIYVQQLGQILQGANLNKEELIGQPLILIDKSKDNLSFTQFNEKVIEEVKKELKFIEKNNILFPNNNNNTDINILYKTYKNKCLIHTVKLSDKCRKCKNIINELKLSINKNNNNNENKEENNNNDNNNNNSYNNQSIIFNTKSSLKFDYTMHNGFLIPKYHLQQNLPLTGNINSLLCNNILSCQYFKEVVIVKNFNEIISEIDKNVTNIEAWAIGVFGVPSTFFCCFYKIFLLNPNEYQINTLLTHKNIYVRITGILFLRFYSEPEYLFDYLKKYLKETKEYFFPTVDKKTKINLKEYVIDLFRELNHYGTILPRIPIKIEREIKMKIILFEEEEKRIENNLNNIKKFNIGMDINVYFNDGKSEKGILKEFDKNKIGSIKVEVKGKEMTVGIGNIELIEYSYFEKKFRKNDNNDNENYYYYKKKEDEKKINNDDKNNHNKHHHNHSHHSHNHSHSHSHKNKKEHSKSHSSSSLKKKERSRDKEIKGDLYEQILEEEKKNSLAKGKYYSYMPTSYKKGLSVNVPGFKKTDLYVPDMKHEEIIIKTNTPENKQIENDNNNSNKINKNKKNVNVNNKKEENERLKKLKNEYQNNNKSNNIKNNKNNKNNRDYIGPDIIKLE